MRSGDQALRAKGRQGSEAKIAQTKSTTASEALTPSLGAGRRGSGPPPEEPLQSSFEKPTPLSWPSLGFEGCWCGHLDKRPLGAYRRSRRQPPSFHSPHAPKPNQNVKGVQRGPGLRKTTSLPRPTGPPSPFWPQDPRGLENILAAEDEA